MRKCKEPLTLHLPPSCNRQISSALFQTECTPFPCRHCFYFLLTSCFLCSRVLLPVTVRTALVSPFRRRAVSIGHFLPCRYCSEVCCMNFENPWRVSRNLIQLILKTSSMYSQCPDALWTPLLAKYLLPGFPLRHSSHRCGFSDCSWRSLEVLANCQKCLTDYVNRPADRQNEPTGELRSGFSHSASTMKGWPRYSLPIPSCLVAGGKSFQDKIFFVF